MPVMLLDRPKRRVAVATTLAAITFVLAQSGFASAGPHVILTHPGLRSPGSPGSPPAPKRAAPSPHAEGSCSISSEDQRLSFGSISGLKSSGATVTASLTVSCSANVTADVLFCDAHAGPGGTFTLTKGEKTIPFTIRYDGGASAGRLNDCGAPGLRLGGSNDAATYKLLATIAATGPIPAGTYTDTITATIIY
jgi:spore coat protein U-like protein